MKHNIDALFRDLLKKSNGRIFIHETNDFLTTDGCIHSFVERFQSPSGTFLTPNGACLQVTNHVVPISSYTLPTASTSDTKCRCVITASGGHHSSSTMVTITGSGIESGKISLLGEAAGGFQDFDCWKEKSPQQPCWNSLRSTSCGTPSHSERFSQAPRLDNEGRDQLQRSAWNLNMV